MLPRPAKLLVLTIVLLWITPAEAADWPMWRHDANRSAASPQELPTEVHLQWVREYPRLKPAWPDQPKMQFDAHYEPVVMGQTLFVGSSRTDSVTALDTRTGAEKWRFMTDGPVRFPPVAWEGRVYFVSDDGYLYCLDGAKGTLVWKFRGGPMDRRILGNERLISTWPARGAPVIADGTVYFAAGIWPFMGIFLHALDARTGSVIWTNDGDGSIYMKQPHNAESFASVAPQGALAVVDDKLIVPGGRSVPAVYNRKTGKLIHYLLAENNKKGGGSEVAAGGHLLFNGGLALDLGTGKNLGECAQPLTFTGDALFSYPGGKCRNLDLQSSSIKVGFGIDLKGVSLKKPVWSIKERGYFEGPRVQTMIKAGSKLYVATENRLLAVELPVKEDEDVRIAWQTDLEGTPVSLLAADDRLFAVTRQGRIYCFGPDRVDPKIYHWEVTIEGVADEWSEKAKTILETTKVHDGYCIVWGVGSGRLILELARQSNLRIIAIDPDPQKVGVIREKLVSAGLYGERVAVHVGDPLTFSLLPYFTSLMASEDVDAAGIDVNAEFLKKAFHSLRPYGGVACLPIPAERDGELARLVAAAGLANAKVRQDSGFLLLSREGALPGSDNWTHEHHDAANTRVSKDNLVKAPLGLLWFGGPSHDGILPRHGHGPQPQVVDGRLFIEGIDMIRAMDVYTGRVLWEAPLPGVGVFYNNTSHQPGANAAGTNYISRSDGIYVVYGKSCLRLDPATGKKLEEFRLPALGEKKETPYWGYLNVAEDYLVGGADPLFDPNLAKLLPKGPATDDDPPDKKEEKKEEKPSASAPKLSKGDNDNLSSSKHLVVMDRITGKVLWTATARSGFRHNAICIGGGRVYCIDRLSGPTIARLKRRGETPTDKPRLLAFDLKTGQQLWNSEENIFGTWLSYSEKHDVLVESGRKAGDTLNDEPKGMRAYRGSNGTVLWDKDHSGPAMIHGETILMAGSACNLLTGDQKMRPDPFTGEPIKWEWCRTYGCNTPAASEHLLTFRSGAAGYYDLANDGGTGNFGGFRSSCTNNLIVAGGILTAPDYTRTCICSYQNQTSLALVHTPEAEMWTYFGTWEVKGPVKRIGINLGAPGDRRADNGTLWLEYPSVGGKSPVVPVGVTGSIEWFRRHELTVNGEDLDWVAASGAKGLESLAITLDKESKGRPRLYTVRLHFLEPDDVKPGERVFDVTLQGIEVLSDFDIMRETSGRNRGLVKEFKGVQAAKELVVKLGAVSTAKLKAPILCGIEVVAEER